MRKTVLAALVVASTALPAFAHETGYAHSHLDASSGDLSMLILQALAAVTLGMFALAITGYRLARGRK